MFTNFSKSEWITVSELGLDPGRLTPFSHGVAISFIKLPAQCLAQSKHSIKVQKQKRLVVGAGRDGVRQDQQGDEAAWHRWKARLQEGYEVGCSDGPSGVQV